MFGVKNSFSIERIFFSHVKQSETFFSGKNMFETEFLFTRKKQLFILNGGEK